jgi:hypothetical protein
MFSVFFGVEIWRDCKKFLFDTSLESESVPIVTSGWRFLFRSLHFRWSFFVHCLSLTGFHSVVNFSNSTVTRGTCLFQDIIRNSTIFTISTTCTQPLYWRNRTLFMLYLIVFHSNRSGQKCDLFSTKVSNKTKYSTLE